MGLCNRARYALAATLLAAAVTSTPASAQEIDFSGGWVPIFHEDGPERIPGPELGDYAGLPINDAARLRADSYDADRISAVTEYQCRPHAADYNLRGLSNMRITAEIDATNPHSVVGACPGRYPGHRRTGNLRTAGSRRPSAFA